MVQLKEIANQVRSQLDNTIIKLKKSARSKPIDPNNDQGGSSCSSEGNESVHASRLLGSVMDTLFGACTGNKNSTTNEVHAFDTLKPIKIGEKTNRALQSLHKSSSNDLKNAGSHVKHARGINQHKEKIHIGNAPYRLCEVSDVNRSAFSEEGSEASCNFDDGISALSAHTLEEMAKAEKILLKKQEARIPREEGFDICLEPSVFEKDAEGPPSPASTVESDDDHSPAQETERNPPEEQSISANANDIKTYPIQMARPRRSSSPDGSASTASEFSATWRKQEENYWAEVVKEDKDTKNVFHTPTKDSNNTTLSTTFSSSRSSISSQKKGRRPRLRILGRRKQYIECDEDEELYEI